MKMMRLWSAIAALVLGALPALAGVEAVNVHEPRAFGYFLGDTLERKVEVVTTGKTELFASSLPRPGPLTYWLDLTAIDHESREEGERTIYDIVLKYQIFYSALDARSLEIPAFPLRFKNAGGEAEGAEDGSAQDAAVPALEIVVSPLRDIVLTDVMPEKAKEVADVLRPDAKPQPIRTRRAEILFAISAAAVLAAILALLRHYAKGPFAKRAGRPFTVADQRIRRLDLRDGEDGGYRESLLILHRAFDESYGRRLFAADVPAFLAKRASFADLAPRLAAFFESSRFYFFSDQRTAAEKKLSAGDIRRLAADLAREERAAA